MSAGADQGWNPYTGEAVGPPVPHATEEEVDGYARAAATAAPGYAALPLTRRADLLRAAPATPDCPCAPASSCAPRSPTRAHRTVRSRCCTVPTRAARWCGTRP